MPLNVDAVIPKGYRESVTVKTADFVRELNYLKECSALTAKPYVRFAGEQLSIAASGGAFETGIEVRGRGDMVLGFDLYWNASFPFSVPYRKTAPCSLIKKAAQ